MHPQNEAPFKSNAVPLVGALIIACVLFGGSYSRHCSGAWCIDRRIILQEDSTAALITADLACSIDGYEYLPGLFNPGAMAPPPPNCPDPRQVMPASEHPFWLGFATAAHQIEGASREDGKGENIWDWFESLPGKINHNSTAAVTDDFYHLYENDIKLMRYLGVRNFRFSIAWSRIMPSGRPDNINQAGVDFYKRLIAALKANCIEPFVTLYHWDLPKPLYDEYSGWISPKVEDDFVVYAETVWQIFGNDVTYWTTFNEPETFCHTGYEIGVHAPGRCSDRSKCSEGNSTTEGILCSYHVLNAHARAEKSFRRLVPNGYLGINLSMTFVKPQTDKEADIAAADNWMQFLAGRYIDVLYNGDWNDVIKANTAPDVLPRFSPEQQERLRGIKQDFLALQHYTSQYAVGTESGFLGGYLTTTDANGVPMPQAGPHWLHIYPKGLRGLLVWLKNRFNNPTIIITENGMAMKNENEMPRSQALCDVDRIRYYQQYIGNATKAVREDGVNLQGYFAWSLLDNFEWADGLKTRFGVVYVDYETQQRYPKTSSLWMTRAFGLRDAPLVALEERDITILSVADASSPVGAEGPSPPQQDAGEAGGKARSSARAASTFVAFFYLFMNFFF